MFEFGCYSEQSCKEAIISVFGGVGLIFHLHSENFLLCKIIKHI